MKEDVEGKLDVLFEDAGEQRLKNIATPVRVYQLRIKGATPTQAPVVADKPSIAVLPFENLSEDPRQEYFADGMVEDMPSRSGELHPEPLTEPDLGLSTYPARATH